MRKAAKIRIAGTLVAIPLQLLWCAAATSQTPPDSGVIKQVQLGDVFDTQTINVVTEDVVVANSLAVGNILTTGSDTSGGRFDAKQIEKGDIGASTTVNVVGYAGVMVTQTDAYGNSGDLIATGGANLSGGLTQKVASGANIEAQTTINAYGAELDKASIQTNAVANTQGIGIEGGGTADMIVRQTSGAVVHASNSTIFGYSPGEVDQGAIATGNNITATGTVGSSQVLQSRQRTVDGHIIAYSAAISGNAQAINNAATASGNNLSASNDGGPLNIAASQVNKVNVRSQALSNAYDFGSNNSMAYSVGNSAMAGETGIELTMDLSQVNRGGVDAISEVDGNTGYDASSTAVAMGNAATGYVCSTCGGQLGVSSRQVNSADVTSSSTINIGGRARSVSGVSTAVGNSATYYSSQPGH
jgi:hypothetical protein